jgi:hypothetical protein
MMTRRHTGSRLGTQGLLDRAGEFDLDATSQCGCPASTDGVMA